MIEQSLKPEILEAGDGIFDRVFDLLTQSCQEFSHVLTQWTDALRELLKLGIQNMQTALDSGILIGEERAIARTLLDITNSKRVRVGLAPDGMIQGYSLTNGDCVEIYVSIGATKLSPHQLAFVFFHELAHAVYEEFKTTQGRALFESQKKELFCDSVSALLMRLSGFHSQASDFPPVPPIEILPSIFSSHPSNIQRIVALSKMSAPRLHSQMTEDVVEKMIQITLPSPEEFIERLRTSGNHELVRLADALADLYGNISTMVRQRINLESVQFKSGDEVVAFEVANSPYDLDLTIKFFNLSDLYEKFLTECHQRIEHMYYRQLRRISPCDSAVRKPFELDSFAKALFLKNVQRIFCAEQTDTSLAGEVSQIVGENQAPMQVTLLIPWKIFPFFASQFSFGYMIVSNAQFNSTLEDWRSKKICIEEFVHRWLRISILYSPPSPIEAGQIHVANPEKPSEAEIRDIIAFAMRNRFCSIIKLLKFLIGEEDLYKAFLHLPLKERIHYLRFIADSLDNDIPRLAIDQNTSIQEVIDCLEYLRPSEFSSLFLSKMCQLSYDRLVVFAATLSAEKTREILRILGSSPPPGDPVERSKQLLKFLSAIRETTIDPRLKGQTGFFWKIYQVIALADHPDTLTPESLFQKYGSLSEEEILQANEFLKEFQGLLEIFQTDIGLSQLATMPGLGSLNRNRYFFTFKSCKPATDHGPFCLCLGEESHDDRSVDSVRLLIVLGVFTIPEDWVLKGVDDLMRRIEISEADLKQVFELFDAYPWSRIEASTCLTSLLPILGKIWSVAEASKDLRELLINAEKIAGWILFDGQISISFFGRGCTDLRFWRKSVHIKELLKLFTLDQRPEYRVRFFALSADQAAELLCETWPEESFARDVLILEWLIQCKDFKDSGILKLFDLMSEPSRCAEFVIKFLDENAKGMTVDMIIHLVSRHIEEPEERKEVFDRYLKNRNLHLSHLIAIVDLGNPSIFVSNSNLILANLADVVARAPTDSKKEYAEWLLDLTDAKPTGIKKVERQVRLDLSFLPDLFKTSQRFRRVALQSIMLGPGGLMEPHNIEILESLIVKWLSAGEVESGAVAVDEQSDLNQLLTRIIPLLFRTSQKFRQFELLINLFDHLYSNTSSKDSPRAERIVSALLQSFGPLGIKIGQLLHHQPLIRDRFPGLLSVFESFKRDADMSLTDAAGLLVRLKDELGLEEEDELKVIGSASIKVVFSHRKINGEAKVIKVSRATFNPGEWLDYLVELREVINSELASTCYSVPSEIPRFLVDTVNSELDLSREGNNYEVLTRSLGAARVPRVYRCGSFYVEEEFVPHTRDQISADHRVKLGIHLLGGLFFGDPFHYDLHQGNVGVNSQEMVVYDTGSVIQLSRDDLVFLSSAFLASWSKHHGKRFVSDLFRKGLLDHDRKIHYEAKMEASKSFTNRLVFVLDAIFEAQLKGLKISDSSLTALLGLVRSVWVFEGVSFRDFLRAGLKRLISALISD